MYVFFSFFISGHAEDGVEHLCNAVTLCGQASHLIQIFQQTLPSEHFELLVQKLPEAKIVRFIFLRF